MIQKMIKKMEDDEERAREEKERAIANAQAGGTNTLITQDPNQPIQNNSNVYYFYNKNTVLLGIADFVKKWGNRKNEDNWRRSNKALVLEDPNAVTTGTTTSKDPKDKTAKADPKKTKEY